jgi:hypothetical protein
MPSPALKTTFYQAERIVSRFGGQASLARAIGVHPASVLRWMRPPPEGTDGLVPSQKIKPVIDAAARLEIRLAPEDWVPVPRPMAQPSLEDMLS